MRYGITTINPAVSSTAMAWMMGETILEIEFDIEAPAASPWFSELTVQFGTAPHIDAFAVYRETLTERSRFKFVLMFDDHLASEAFFDDGEMLEHLALIGRRGTDIRTALWSAAPGGTPSGSGRLADVE